MKCSTTAAPSFVYDVETVAEHIALGTYLNLPVPEARAGEVVVYYGGWGLPFLRSCHAGKQHIMQDDWYDHLGFTADHGYYRLLLPVPDSNRKNWNEQVAHLHTIDESWHPAPVCVAATALLVHLNTTGQDLLDNGLCQCAELVPVDFRMGLCIKDGRMCVWNYWAPDLSDDMWLAAAQKC